MGSDYEELSPKYEISPRYYGHKSSRREERIYMCKICKRTFNRRHNLTKHERTHSGDKPYRCTTCGKKFADSSNLTKHVQRTHAKYVSEGTPSDEKSGHKCGVCHRYFESQDELFQHEMKYANSRIHACPVCGKAFHLRNSYSRHVDTHNEKRRYHCDMCDRTFSQKFLLEKHRQYHAPDNNEINIQCEDEFTEEYNEEEEHEEEEDMEYNLNADNNAKYESDVEGSGHRERIGTAMGRGKGITVHECTMCDKVFTLRSLFTRHLKAHSSDNSFRCHLCHQLFKRQYYLVKHRRTCKGVVDPGKVDPRVIRESDNPVRYHEERGESSGGLHRAAPLAFPGLNDSG